MNEHFSLGMGVILLSGILNGAFPLPMKSIRGWQWENTWLAFSIAGVLLLPWILAFLFVPHLLHVYKSAPIRSVEYTALFGFLWGIAQVTFGLGIDAVGMAISIAVVSGLGALFGSLVPLLAMNPEDLFQARGVFLLIALPILLAGLYLYGRAGRLREKDLSASTPRGARNFARGLAICIFTGIFTATFNLGFAFSPDLQKSAVALGATPSTATYPVWALIFGAGFLPNAIYCIYLLSRNGSWQLFRAKHSFRNAGFALAMAVLWGTGVFGYGIGANMAGTFGTSIGFTLFMASSILAANAFGIWSGEWKTTTSRTRQTLALGLLVILISVVVLNLPGFF